MSRSELQKIIGLNDRKSFTNRYLNPAVKDKLIEMTIPSKPNSISQKYRLTKKGFKVKKNDCYWLELNVT